MKTQGEGSHMTGVKHQGTPRIVNKHQKLEKKGKDSLLESLEGTWPYPHPTYRESRIRITLNISSETM